MPFSQSDSFERREFSHCRVEDDLEDLSFHRCVFRNISLQSRRLAECIFDDCEFIQCNLSLAELASAVFSGVTFRDCKLLGLNWTGTGGFLTASFEGCIMDNNLFADMNLSKFRFSGCSLMNATFSNIKLTEAVFDECELSGCQFHNTDLTRADFRTSRNYYMNAETNTLRKTVFSLPEAVSLLGNLDIVLD
ncbi:pentapeptide repeat-containing protein [Salidesulfovibrio brasiliensis]|uniref:pentapeptide repeat-containing protein n=1 Tax=Salidesulfovibrio brasiliensis TaxID=221711 RepID=UPI0006D06C33|nr:pentapeptide repeat-containing protein [Salidesulfovibrio brasiliensis]